MYFEFSVRLVERAQRFNPRRPEAQIRGSLINNLKQMEDGRWTWKHDRRRGIRRDSGGEMNEAAWADLAQVRAPTLVVRGAESNMLSPQTAAKMHRVLSDSRLAEVPKAGYLVQGDSPVAFERAVHDFFSV
jgi:pimeloyl-ACP methyl ester carboxylesterase